MTDFSAHHIKVEDDPQTDNKLLVKFISFNQRNGALKSSSRSEEGFASSLGPNLNYDTSLCEGNEETEEKSVYAPEFPVKTEMDSDASDTEQDDSYEAFDSSLSIKSEPEESFESENLSLGPVKEFHCYNQAITSVVNNYFLGVNNITMGTPPLNDSPTLSPRAAKRPRKPREKKESPATGSSAGAEGKRFICDQCARGFKLNQHLLEHMKIHTGVKPYPCKECGQAFRQSSILRNHMRQHTGEKPYICQVCNSAFTRSGSLFRHMRIHTGEKPHTCSECGKSFRQTGALHTHMRLHTGDKPYSCGICNAVFAHSAGLAQHAKMHSAEKSYCCTHCEKSFTHYNSLKYHMNKFHDGKSPHNMKRTPPQFNASEQETPPGGDNRGLVSEMSLPVFPMGVPESYVVRECSVSVVPDSSLSVVPESTVLAVSGSSVSGLPESSVTSVPGSSVYGVPESSVSSVPEKSLSGVPGSLLSGVPENSVSGVPESSIASIPGYSLSDVPECSVSSEETPNAECRVDDAVNGKVVIDNL